MSVVYNNTLKTTRMTSVRTAVDAGPSFGTIEIGTAAMAAVLAIITLPKPMSSEAVGVLTILGVPLTSAAAIGAGTAAAARFKDSTGAVVVSSLTVGTAASDLIITNTTIAIGDLIQLNSGTITHG